MKTGLRSFELSAALVLCVARFAAEVRAATAKVAGSASTRIFASTLVLSAMIVSVVFVPETPAQRSSDAGSRISAPAVESDNTSDLAPASSQIDIVGPAGSERFGDQVYVLQNGNIVVTDPLFDITTPNLIQDVGAVYLYHGETLELISQVTGSTENDRVGFADIKLLSNSNFLVHSPYWNNGATQAVGAVTWGSGNTGISGVVSATNSLVGSSANDIIGASGISVLSNGNYVVRSPSWNSSTGAVTWGSATTGISGVVSATNSLVGSTANDAVGSMGVTELTNGNYVVRSQVWDNGTTQDVGAATWVNGTTGIIGVVSATNSLVGSTAGDNVGAGVTALTNGNYVVHTAGWDNGAIAQAGAVTFGNGTTGISGPVSPLNSLIGSAGGDVVGNGGVTALSNGNYVVSSRNWANGAITQAGAATWGSGTTGITGLVSSSNSMVGSAPGDFLNLGGVTALANGNYVVWIPNWGSSDLGAVTLGIGTGGTVGDISAANARVGSTANDRVGSGGVTALSNGNYVVSSPNWAYFSVNGAGAVTLGSGTTRIGGAVSISNSLVGLTENDNVGSGGITALSNGNFVVSSPLWGSNDLGAVTWGSGTTASSGSVSSANSLYSLAANDRVGSGGVAALPNGNYVVSTPLWRGDDIGAVTWGDGTTGISGAISDSNSLVGSREDDNVGNNGVIVFNNGNYLVRSTAWNLDTSTQDVGAVTWGNGTTGISGEVSALNSLVGSTPGDAVGSGGVIALSMGNYVVRSNGWDNGSTVNTGAVTYGSGNGGTTGVINTSNSVLGTVADGNVAPASPANQPITNERLIVGRRSSNIVTIFNPTYKAVADGNWSDPATWNYGAFSKTHNVLIPNGRSVTLDIDVLWSDGSVKVESGGQLLVDGERFSASPIMNQGFVDLSLGKLNMGSNLFSSSCNALVNGQGSNNYVIGSSRKEFCSLGSFTFPSGTANGYAPVNVNVTALGSVPSSLTISSTQSVHPELYALNSLNRYWTLTESGDLTADLLFNYLDPIDIVGNENIYRLYRVTAGNATHQSSAVLDTAANTMFISSVSEFSDWAIGRLAPTSASVAVSGIVNARGMPVRGAIVSFTDSSGNSRSVQAGSLGWFTIHGLSAGVTYIVQTSAGRHSFIAQAITITDNIDELRIDAVD